MIRPASPSESDDGSKPGGGIEVFVADHQHDETIDLARWEQLARVVLEHEGVVGAAELSVDFVDQDAMADLNGRFMGQVGATDVLAFPIDDEPAASVPDRSGLPRLLGDVVICPAVAARNAPDHAGTFDDEIALLVVHGILHVLGMDHAEPDEAAAMQAHDREHLDRFAGASS